MPDRIIYLDNAATTKVNEEILNTYIKANETYFANASSIHYAGQQSSRILDKSRESILNTLKLANTHQVIFTSGATEANNLAIKGFALKFKNRGNHIIVSAVEHASVLEVAKQLEKEFNFEITYLSVQEDGKVNLDELRKAIKKETILVSVMAVNNEVGSINDIEGIAKLLKGYPKIAFHVDATQAIGKIDINYQDVDMLSFSAHKIHGIKGSGALLKKKNIELLDINSGGGQEFGLRSGTNDVAASICLAKALQLAVKEQKEALNHVKNLVEPLYAYLKNNPDLYLLNSSKENPFIVNFSLKTKKASVIVEGLSNNNIMVSSISACHSKKEAYSHVVKAMGRDDSLTHNTVRVSLDFSSTKEDIETFIKTLDKFVKEVKQ